MNNRKILYLLLFIIIVSMGFKFIALPLLEKPNTLYRVVEKDSSEKAIIPVQHLILSIEKGNWNDIKHYFSQESVYISFMEEFNFKQTSLPVTYGGFFEENSISFELESVIPMNKEEYPDFKIDFSITMLNEKDRKVDIQFVSSFDPFTKSYLIKSFDTRELALGDSHSASKIGLVSARAQASFEKPKLSPNLCANESMAGFTYIQLKHKTDAKVVPHNLLGEVTYKVNNEVPADFYGTQAIVQAQFAPREFEEGEYKPGYVISSKDTDDNELGALFRYIIDADATLKAKDQDGTEQSYPIGFILDSRDRKMVALSDNNDLVLYGRQPDQYLIERPVAISVIGDFIYILDNGKAGNNALIKILKYSVSEDGLVLDEVDAIDFNLNLKNATDIAGLEKANENLLYISTLNAEIIKVSLDPSTGLQRANTSMSKYKNSEAYNEGFGYLDNYDRIEVISLGSESEDVTILAITNNQAVVLTDNGNNDKLFLKYRYDMPMGSTLKNVGYNLGENTFNVVDYTLSKVHIFSYTGEYLASGGEKGKGATDEEFFYPNFISSNAFTNKANEMIVGSEWGKDTGFKRVFPLADLGKFEVIEKAAINTSDVDENALLFRFALSSGYNVNEINLFLNDDKIKTINSNFVSDVYSESFSTSGTGDNSIKEKLKSGWNTVKVEMVAALPGPSVSGLQYTREKTVEFYYLPSVFDASASASTQNKTPLHDSVENTLEVYKNMTVKGEGLFSLSGGKTILMKSCTLSVAKETELQIKDEFFEFRCGANLKVNVQEDVPKELRNSEFNGLGENYNMISLNGDFTGGLGSGSASSSQLKFIDCKFEGYNSKAIALQEGRAAFANCEFTATIKDFYGKSSEKVAAIVAGPETRLDIRGGIFQQNDIAIDGNAAELYIGHPAKNFNDEVRTSDPQFVNNTIGVYNFAGSVTAKHSIFSANDYGIVSLSGQLDMAKNAQNMFRENETAVLFSNNLQSDQGNNYFIENNADISFVLPQETLNEGILINLECNYWMNNGLEGNAVLHVIDEDRADWVTFDTEPFMIQKGNGSSAHYTCSGKKENSVNSLPGELSNIPISDQQLRVEALMSSIEHENFYANWQSELDNSSTLVRINTFINPADTSGVYRQAVMKNVLFSYLLKDETIDSYEAYQRVAVDAQYQDMYQDMVYDKLKFVALLQKEKQLTPETFNVLEVEGNTLNLFPNPVDLEMNVLLRVENSGHYGLSLFDKTGRNVKTFFDNQQLNAGQHHFLFDIAGFSKGFYVLTLINYELGEKVSVKVIKK